MIKETESSRGMLQVTDPPLQAGLRRKAEPGWPPAPGWKAVKEADTRSLLNLGIQTRCLQGCFLEASWEILGILQ